MPTIFVARDAIWELNEDGTSRKLTDEFVPDPVGEALARFNRAENERIAKHRATLRRRARLLVLFLLPFALWIAALLWLGRR